MAAIKSSLSASVNFLNMVMRFNICRSSQEGYTAFGFEGRGARSIVRLFFNKEGGILSFAWQLKVFWLLEKTFEGCLLTRCERRREGCGLKIKCGWLDFR